MFMGHAGMRISKSKASFSLGLSLISRESYDVALWAAGGVLAACDEVMEGRAGCRRGDRPRRQEGRDAQHSSFRRISVAENDLRQARARVDSLKGRLDRLQALEIRGMISKAEAQQLRYALDAAQAELKLAALEADVLEKIK
jgi:hypothetical protein